MAEGDWGGDERPRGSSGSSYWVCKICPAADECSEQAFGRAKCWGWTLGECKHRHLQSSGKHTKMTKDERTHLTENAHYEEQIDVNDDEPDPQWNDDGEVTFVEGTFDVAPPRAPDKIGRASCRERV